MSWGGNLQEKRLSMSAIKKAKINVTEEDLEKYFYEPFDHGDGRAPHPLDVRQRAYMGNYYLAYLETDVRALEKHLLGPTGMKRKNLTSKLASVKGEMAEKKARVKRLKKELAAAEQALPHDLENLAQQQGEVEAELKKLDETPVKPAPAQVLKPVVAAE